MSDDAGVYLLYAARLLSRSIVVVLKSKHSPQVQLLLCTASKLQVVGDQKCLRQERSDTKHLYLELLSAVHRTTGSRLGIVTVNCLCRQTYPAPRPIDMSSC